MHGNIGVRGTRGPLPPLGCHRVVPELSQTDVIRTCCIHLYAYHNQRRHAVDTMPPLTGAKDLTKVLSSYGRTFGLSLRFRQPNVRRIGN